MDLEVLRKKQPAEVDLELVGALIARTQKENGEIPWHPGGKTDPWDHVESAMGLAICGYLRQARLAYQWLADGQLSDGSWYASYQDGIPLDKTRDTNVTAYIAVGVYHYYLMTGDRDFLEQMWDPVSSAIDFAIGLQAKTGEIYWAKNPDLEIDPMALLTGSSSIFMSLKCALAVAKELGIRREDWKIAALKLQKAIGSGYHLFNIAKSHYSMDWFYPVLCGALTHEAARKRLDQYWKKFVVEEMGVLCVSNRPWVTIAETCELVLALAATENENVGEIVFNWMHERRFEDGTYWCGFTYPDMVIWPEEKITWTNGVLLMAADALYHLTPASRLFNQRFWQQAAVLE
ncbi:MAG: phenyltransferase domain-containing protein [Desulfobacterales bacterium]|nr:phenyltransferase domain-containing protein [Desulfobacterales bacterium]MBS3754348.1 phenyltransferase domain-containing protein [Desulfobacterales bacterium]